MTNIAGKRAPLVWAMHVAVFLLVVIWLVPTVGLFVSSFRDRDQITVSGWWEAPFAVENSGYGRTDADAALREGDIWVIEGNILDSAGAEGQFGADADVRLVAFGTSLRRPSEFPAGEVASTEDGERFRVEADGTYRVELPEDPGDRAPRIYFTAQTPPSFTLQNYGTVLTAAGMDRAFLNTLTVAIPSTVIPILVAAYAAYAIAWMDFRFRNLILAAIVGALVVPHQLALVPLLRLHQAVGIGQSFLGIWLAHSGFGLALAIYLLRNYMAGLPRDIIESAKVDGASDFQIFRRIVLPLSFPALAAFSIFQFLWTYNDLLVAKVFLPSNETSRVMTVKIADDLLGSRGGDWGILASAAFVSIAVPLVVFFTMQKYLVRGLLAGSVK
ncbi:ABC transporter permease [Roseivivax halodurans JCM 10272]|uniref:ABC transporter permease n=1 Tax=Roseivivax halodurans JCM 10272 TaxID=1449350 RepID=X7EA52_9RHOB|nr:carbohydrate ABC transporter permease [Roseivivax halodurans]ETX12745.1 ABC transporter permease [Roseivivax halodurans JCM 10272]